jgi:hypothetical protein
MNAEERKRRITQDDGGRDETVWVTDSGRCEVYHDDRTCSGFRREATRRSLARELAQHRNFAPCAICVLSGTPDAAPDRSEYSHGMGPETRYAELLDKLRAHDQPD